MTKSDKQIIESTVAAMSKLKTQEAAELLAGTMQEFHERGRLESVGNLLSEMVGLLEGDRKAADWVMAVSAALSRIEQYEDAVKALGEALAAGTIVNTRFTGGSYNKKVRFPFRGENNDNGKPPSTQKGD